MRSLSVAVALSLFAIPAAVSAYLPVGTKVPDFTTQGALAGKIFTVTLADMLKKGPVVLYFYPAAFTPGCTAEAHEFAEATDDFAKAGATVIGMSGDSLPRLQQFSVQECRNKFAVAAASPAVIAAYDVQLGPAKAALRTNRTSYVIAPNGRVILAHSDMNYREHVAKTLAAVRQWQAKHRKKG